MKVEPACPTLLIFARNDSFHVSSVIEQLQDKANVLIRDYDAKHGFMDNYSKNYDKEAAESAEEEMCKFLDEL